MNITHLARNRLRTKERTATMPENLTEFRCRKCNKLLGKFHGKAEVKCPRCGAINTGEFPNRGIKTERQ